MKKLAFVISIALAGACGGDDSGTGDAAPDAPIDTPSTGVCGAPAATLSTYPAVHRGATHGAGRHLSVADGACATQHGYFGDDGEDQVIALTGLTAGTHYVIELNTNDDLSMYLATSCDGAGPAAGACLLHVDEQFDDELGEFDAPASGEVYVIIDASDDPIPDTGEYALLVHTVECSEAGGGCTGGDQCINQGCAACGDSFDCTAAAEPLCDVAIHACVAGGSACTGDDAGEPDDGPVGARPLAFPTAATPTTTNAAICSSPAIERDWYSFAATAAAAVRVSVTWTTPNTDIDFRVIAAADGTVVAAGTSVEETNEIELVPVPSAGTYYVEIQKFADADVAAASPYILTLAIPECETSFDCTAPLRPVCDGGGSCVAGPAVCTGDDPAEPDDGPAAARPIIGNIGVATTLTGSVCNTTADERDWYRLDVGNGEGVRLELNWASADDLDIAVFDAAGHEVGLGFWQKPEVVTLTYLPAGAYYVAISRAAAAVVPAVPYMLTSTRSVAQTCTAATDCAAIYSNQFYRGDCTGGSCHFIAAGARADGMTCDTGDDCQSRQCSYSLFEDDAQKSVCSHMCTTSADCAALGTGYACTTGFSPNICMPSCLRDLDCGADPGSADLTTGQPWDYFTCTAASGVCSP